MHFAALTALTLLLLCPPRDIRGDLAKADRLFERQRWEAAADLYEEVTAADPSQGEAWFHLGFARHQQGEYEAACVAHERAAADPRFRPTALYNLACARTLLGQIKEGAEALETALEAGFLDFDTMATDTDIAPLRDAGHLTLAPERTYTPYKHSNRVTCGYEVILPEGADPTQKRPALVCFAPGSGRERSADWFTANVLADGASKAGWTVIVLVAPAKGWQNHPAHHALEGLLKKVRKEHAIEGKFHSLGYADGARSAATYARMSRKYFATLTTVSSRAWMNWGDPGKSFRDGMPVHVIAGETDVTAVAEARFVEKDFEKHDGNCLVTIVSENGRLVTGLRGAELFEAIQSTTELAAAKR